MRLPTENQLLSRDDFKRYGFARAGGKCVFCSAPAADPHHILERKLFPDQGFYLGNCAAVCNQHHWMCETTEFSVEEVRAAAGINEPVLPPGFDTTTVYDKWGNVIRVDGMRVAGVLANDDGMRKALKYGRFLHLLIPER